LRKSTGWKIAGKRTCGKTTTEMGIQHQEGLLVATEYKGLEKTGKGQRYLEANYSKGQGLMRAVALLKKKQKKKKKMKKKKVEEEEERRRRRRRRGRRRRRSKLRFLFSILSDLQSLMRRHVGSSVLLQVFPS
jgi:hypothetical protein